MWTLLLLVAFLGAIIIYLIKKSSGSKENDLKKRGIPWIESEDIQVSSIARLLGKVPSHDVDTKIYKLIKERGHEFAGFMELGTPTIMCTDLEFLRLVYVKDFEYFVNRQRMEMEDTDPHFHNMLFNHENQKWKDLRNSMTPAFSTGKIRKMFQILENCAERLTNFLHEEIQHSDGVVNLRDNFSNYLMEIIANSVYGIEAKMYEEPNSMYGKMTSKFRNQFSGFKNNLKLGLITWSPKLQQLLGLSITDQEADGFFSKVIMSAIQHRRKTGEDRNDFLQLMLEAQKGKLKLEDSDKTEKEITLADGEDKPSSIELTDDLIVAQCLMFLFGGLDTTEVLLYFAFYHMALNPEIQEKVFEEIELSLKKNGGKITYDSVNEFQYLDMVSSEVLRMYPPGTRVDRTVTKDYKVPNSDVIFPKGTIAIIPIYGIHYDEELYPEPERFDPERFSPENKVNRHPYAYMPFGHGQRKCIATRFALTEAKVGIAHVVRNFILEPTGKTPMTIQYENLVGGLKPKEKLWLKLRPRNKKNK